MPIQERHSLTGET